MDGPEHEGWSMILHTSVGSPEYANIKICPFCEQKLLNIKAKKQ
jgi:hypothetical protein